MMDDNPLARKVFSFVLCALIGGYAGYFIVTRSFVEYNRAVGYVNPFGCPVGCRLPPQLRPVHSRLLTLVDARPRSLTAVCSFTVGAEISVCLAGSSVRYDATSTTVGHDPRLAALMAECCGVSGRHSFGVLACRWHRLRSASINRRAFASKVMNNEMQSPI